MVKTDKGRCKMRVGAKVHQTANLKALSMPVQRQQLWEMVKTGNGRCGARLLNTTLL